MAVALDTTNKGTIVTISGTGNRTCSTTTNSFGLARSSTTYTAGVANKIYVEGVAVSGIGGTANALGMGPGLAAANLNAYLGSDTNGLGYYDGNTSFFNGGGGSGFGAWSNGATVGICFNFGSNLLWGTKDGGTTWNTGGTDSPITPSGGYSFSGFNGSAIYLYFAIDDRNSSTAEWTANFAASSFTNSSLFTTLQSHGYAAWDPGAAASPKFAPLRVYLRRHHAKPARLVDRFGRPLHSSPRLTLPERKLIIAKGL